MAWKTGTWATEMMAPEQTVRILTVALWTRLWRSVRSDATEMTRPRVSPVGTAVREQSHAPVKVAQSVVVMDPRMMKTMALSKMATAASGKERMRYWVAGERVPVTLLPRVLFHTSSTGRPLVSLMVMRVVASTITPGMAYCCAASPPMTRAMST